MSKGLRKIKKRKGERMFKRYKRLVELFLELQMNIQIIKMNVFGSVGKVNKVLKEGGVKWFEDKIKVN